MAPPPAYAAGAPHPGPASVQAGIPEQLRPMSTGQYILTLILLSIPFLNLLLLLLWAFGGGTNVNKQNFCRAILILSLLGVLLAIVILVAAYQGMVNLPNARLRP